MEKQLSIYDLELYHCFREVLSQEDAVRALDNMDIFRDALMKTDKTE